MNGNRLLYSECLRVYEVEESFLESLLETGLIHTAYQDDEWFIEYEDLSDLEQFVRWHKDMDINVEGIEALYYMLERVRSLQMEMERVRAELQFYKSIGY